MVLEELLAPVVLAPLAGGPSTPELAAAVSDAGGFGFLGSGYLSAEQIAERITATRRLTERPFGVNLFHPGSGPADGSSYEAYVEGLRQWAQRNEVELGEPRYSDDEWDAKLELLTNDPVG